MTSDLFQSETRVAVPVLLPLPLAGAYDYTVNADAGPVPARGAHVRVTLGPRLVDGVVWGAAKPLEDLDVAAARLKPVTLVHDAPPLPAQLCDFVDWVADYTLNPPGAVLAMALRSAGVGEPPRTRTLVRRGSGEPERMTAAREKVLAIAADGLARSSSDLAGEAGVGASVVRGLIDQGALETVLVTEDTRLPRPDPALPGKELSESQREAAQALCEVIGTARFAPMLLDGVTGSGKTEVYFEAVAEALRADRQVLILLPEIALTVQFLDRFAARFGCRPAQWHSDLGSKDRRRIWSAVARGDAKVVVGARSALFLPYADLGLIVVDEEHESAFKQEEGVTYHARDMAVVRARFADCPVVLASATPAIETLTNVEQGRYGLVRLPERAGSAGMPDVEALDLRKAPPPGRDRWLSPRLVDALGETFARGEQGLLFLNRRGYAPLVICRACGHRMTAPDTESWLVEHRYANRLVCHLTGFSMPRPDACPACGEPDALHSCGPGVERVAEEAQMLFPDARLAVMSSDLISSPSRAQTLIEAMQGGEIDLLVGTQMVAKGHNFPNLTLVGVVDADLGLSGGDLRAGERTYQLLHQVSGRAGRAERPGRVMLQTHMPDHPVMQALVTGDRDAFIGAETAAREMAGMPPFGRLGAIIMSSEDNEALHDLARAMVRHVPQADDVQVLGPAVAPIAMLRGRHRMRFLVKAARTTHIQAFLRTWLSPLKIPAKIRLSVDIDPYSFL